METIPIDEETIKNEEVITDNSVSSQRIAGTKRRGADVEVDEDEEITNNGKAIIAGIDKKITVPMDEYIGVLLKSEERKDPFFCQAPGCIKSFDSISTYTDHYLQNHMHTCGTCKRKLPGSHLLELHVLEQHDTLFSLMAERKPMYACLAEECLLKFATPQERYNHVNEEHKHHEMFHAFKHFQNTDYGNKTQSNSKNNTRKNNNKSGKSGKDVEMEVEITPATSGKEEKIQQGTGNEAIESPIMELEKDEKQEKNNVHQKSNKNSHPTTTTHISFGHHESRFQPFHSTKNKSQKPVKSTTPESTTDNAMNMDSMKESLDISITEIDK